MYLVYDTVLYTVRYSIRYMVHDTVHGTRVHHMVHHTVDGSIHDMVYRMHDMVYRTDDTVYRIPYHTRYRAVHDTVHDTVHDAGYRTVHDTVHNTVDGPIYDMVYRVNDQVHCTDDTAYRIRYQTRRGTPRYSLVCLSPLSPPDYHHSPTTTTTVTTTTTAPTQSRPKKNSPLRHPLRVSATSHLFASPHAKRFNNYRPRQQALPYCCDAESSSHADQKCSDRARRRRQKHKLLHATLRFSFDERKTLDEKKNHWTKPRKMPQGFCPPNEIPPNEMPPNQNTSIGPPTQ